MDQTVPDWVCKEFFTQWLQKEKESKNLEVTNFVVSSAAPPGNNYGSFIIRVKLEYNDGKEHNSLSIIVKAELTEGPIKDLASEFQKNEPGFYQSFIPKAKNFTDTWFVPSNYSSPKPNVTILEDLKDKGFVMADRTKQLDFDHCRLYMMASASLHAVSVAVYKQHPELAEPIKKETMFSHEAKASSMFQMMVKGGMKCFVDAIVERDRSNKYIQTLKDTTPHLWDMVVEAQKPNKTVNTIRQGDPWITNMMFKYDEKGIVSDIKLIDFQAIQYGSPISDIIFFIWSSANNDVKKNKLGELYRIYLETFNEKLKQFNCPETLTYEQLIADVKRLSPVALFIAACFIPMVTGPEPMDLGMFLCKEDDVAGPEKGYQKYYSENYCKNYFPDLLENLEINGVFKCLEKFQK